ncbi:MAG: efflux RND transporter periplasmic adaptor subunit, partial [Bryobacteraceae bacterium]|nr:efflux RND transporter periplasmic adaptor subunit [Bryobacteraceae bacterium]
IVTTDAYPDRKYEGLIRQISPEANRQKATVQVKVKILNPDDYLRPEMNASVAFLGDPPAGGAPSRRQVSVPASAVRGGAVFVFRDGKALRRAVRTGARRGTAVTVEQGLEAGEVVIVNPPEGLKDGARVRAAGA